jgi:hypothetical protein
VTIRLGGTVVASGTTNSSGVYSTILASTGTYSITAVKSRFDGVIGYRTFSTGDTTKSITLSLSPATGYVCCAGCVDPFPETLYYTGELGTITLTYNAGTWRGSTVVSVSDAATCTWDGDSCDCTYGTSDVTVNYSVSCPTYPSTTWTIVAAARFTKITNTNIKWKADGGGCDPEGGGTYGVSTTKTGCTLPITGTMTCPGFANYPDCLEFGDFVVGE